MRRVRQVLHHWPKAEKAPVACYSSSIVRAASGDSRSVHPTTPAMNGVASASAKQELRFGICRRGLNDDSPIDP